MSATNPGSILNCASLANFFVFTPKDVPEGKEYEKLLYYFPNTDEIEIQTKQVGLSEALVNFTRAFSPDKPCEVVHYEKHTSVVLEPESNIWIVMVSNQEDLVFNFILQKVSNPTVTKIKDGAPVIEYKENELDDISLKTILRQIYQIFRFCSSCGCPLKD
jgi:hypothetical protein